MPVRSRSVASFVALLALIASLVVPAVPAASAVPIHTQRWIASAPNATALNQALAAHEDKIPVEFYDRLAWATKAGQLRAIVALDQRDAAIESFVAANSVAVKWYGDAPRFYGLVTQAQLTNLLNASFVRFVEPDYKITNFLSTSTVETHARSTNHDGTGVWSFDKSAGPRGSLVSDVPGLTADQATGKDVTVAITDSGIDRTNKDFSGWGCDPGPYQPCNSRIVKAITVDQLVGDTGIDPGDAMPTTEAASGHGTHVAGIIAGNAFYIRDGSTDARYGGDGLNFGMAPQANLVSVKNGDVNAAGLSDFALQWQIDHADEFGIRVSSNSWGCLGGCSFNPNSAEAQIFKDLYNAGIVTVFAAGNDGGTNNGAAFSGTAQSPYVLGVAAYDDGNHQLASFSSRGGDNTLPDPTTWTPQSEGTTERRPDIAAPGVGIWSTASLTGGEAAGLPRVATSDVTGGKSTCCTVEYRQMSGTSMATPHVAGAVALLAGACPTAGPLDYMRAIMVGANPNEVLKTGSATAVAEPFERGYGSLEVRASLDWLRNQSVCGGTGGGGTPTPTPTTDPSPSPTATAPAPADSTTYYFHSGNGSNTVDQADGSATFDTTTPSFDDPAEAIDAPGLQNVKDAAEVVDPVWNGTLTKPADSVSLDFWARSTPAHELGEVTYTVRVSTGGDYFELLPAIESTTDNTDFINVKETFTKMADASGAEVPLSLPAGPLTIAVRGTYTVDNAVTEIYYDAKTYASGFTASSGGSGGTDPSPTPTDSTPPPPPPPAGDRGTYPTTPDDPYFGPGDSIDPVGQLGFGMQWGPQKINAPQAWQEQQATGYGVRVAVLDSGLDLGHPDLQCPGKVDVVANSDVVDNDSDPSDGHVGHGTHVAGIIGACTNNGEGIAGVAPDATIVPIRVLDETGSGTDAQLIAGIRRAISANAQVINMSLGKMTPSNLDIFDETAFDKALSDAADAGIVIVVAAGNDGVPLCDYPGLHEDVVCVGATDRNDNKTWYSNFDDHLVRGGAQVVAPGGAATQTFCDLDSQEILSLIDREVDKAEGDCDTRPGYADMAGTSMATPHVAGVAALLYDRLGGVRSVENEQTVINALTSTAVDLGVPGEDPVYGSGRVDALAAIQSVDAVAPPAPVAATTSVAFTPSSATSAQFSDNATIAARLVDQDGNPIKDADLVFALAGANGSRDWTVTTDADGLASRSLTFNDDPGSYQLTVRYEGEKDVYLASANVTGFVVGQDTSATALKVMGKGSDSRLWSNTIDADSASGLSSVTIEYFADGVSLGTTTTDSAGAAGLALPAKYRNGHHNYEAVFSGNSYYTRSADKQKT